MSGQDKLDGTGSGRAVEENGLYELYEILSTSGQYQWPQPRTIVHVAPGFPLLQVWIYVQHRKEIRHAKVLVRVMAFLCGGIQLLPRRALTVGLGMESPVLRGIQSVKDTDKDLEDY